MYDDFKHFSSEVIKTAVKDINQVSNIIVTPGYEREARAWFKSGFGRRQSATVNARQ